MNTETFVMKTEIPCIKDFGYGWRNGELLEGYDYTVTNLKLGLNPEVGGIGYSFELWDEDGLIGNYKVRKSDWENGVRKIAI